MKPADLPDDAMIIRAKCHPDAGVAVYNTPQRDSVPDVIEACCPELHFFCAECSAYVMTSWLQRMH